LGPLLGANQQLFKKKLNRGAAHELPAAKINFHFIFAPRCRIPMSPKLGHLMGLSCPMLALHWFWFGTSAWCESATFQEKVKQGSCARAPSSKNQFSLHFCTTLQNSNKSQTWPPGGSDMVGRAGPANARTTAATRNVGKNEVCCVVRCVVAAGVAQSNRKRLSVNPFFFAVDGLSVRPFRSLGCARCSAKTESASKRAKSEFRILHVPFEFVTGR